MLNHINGYALALFSLAKEENKLKKYKKNSIDLIHAFSHNVDYIKIMDSRDIDIHVKQELLSMAFKTKVEKNILNFIKLLTDRLKFGLILQILPKLIKLINNKLHIDEGIVYTINKITSLELKKIEQSTSKQLGHKIYLKNKIDKNLVSGFKIVVEDEFIEDTILSRLEQIKYELLDKEGKIDAS